ncbi:MAG: hypothetical protein PF440_05760 [Thiomicrorhabdus sp.]|nr:hypothetical protein [Thiomicrorhabdus sp.]
MSKGRTMTGLVIDDVKQFLTEISKEANEIDMAKIPMARKVFNATMLDALEDHVIQNKGYFELYLNDGGEVITNRSAIEISDMISDQTEDYDDIAHYAYVWEVMLLVTRKIGNIVCSSDGNKSEVTLGIREYEDQECIHEDATTREEEGFTGLLHYLVECI